MIFSDFYKSQRSPLSKLRHNQPSLTSNLTSSPPAWASEDYADLLSRDKTKQKAAVKKYLDAKVKNDWDFSWPAQVVGQPVASSRHDDVALRSEPLVHDEAREDDGYKVDEESDASHEDGEDEGDLDDTESVYSVVSQDETNWKPRMEWESDLSDDEPDEASLPPATPELVRSEIRASRSARRDQRRRQVREEISWNPGLACFEARRNAWTGAKIARVRTKPTSPPLTSPRSPRRFFFRRSMSGSPPSPTNFIQPTSAEASGATSDASSIANNPDRELSKQGSKDTCPSTPPSPESYPVETLLPLAQPLLPPNSPFRATITPSIYMNLYDKIILHNLQPSCPINLADMLRSCVAGWKRDGEWPPRPVAPIDAVLARKQKRLSTVSAYETGGKAARRMSFGLLSRDKEDESKAGKGIRKSLQRALRIGSSPEHNEHLACGGEKMR